MFVIIRRSYSAVTVSKSSFAITALHYWLPTPNCIYTIEREYANCNHQHKYFKEVTHE